jgi:hypothetical protein
MLSVDFSFRLPDIPAMLTAVVLTTEELEAAKVRDPGAPNISEREDGVAVTPDGRPDAVTVTAPSKPFCSTIDTCTLSVAPPSTRETLLGESESVKLGCGGGGGVPPLPMFAPPPPPHEATTKSRRQTLIAKRYLCHGDIEGLWQCRSRAIIPNHRTALAETRKHR